VDRLAYVPVAGQIYRNTLCRRCSGTGSSAGYTGGGSGGSSETRMSDVSSCRCCIVSSMPYPAPAPFLRLNEDLRSMVRSRTKMIPKLREFRRPVRIIFGDADPSLNSGVARTFHEFPPESELFLIPGARHFVQLDEPKQVARLILAMPGPGGQGCLLSNRPPNQALHQTAAAFLVLGLRAHSGDRC
jgi:hypothetical protein